MFDLTTEEGLLSAIQFIKEQTEPNTIGNGLVADVMKAIYSISKPYKEIIGYVSQTGLNDPQLTIIHTDIPLDFDANPSLFSRVGDGIFSFDFSLIGVSFDVNKVIFQNSIHYFESDHPIVIYGDFFLVLNRESSNSTELLFYNYPNGLNAQTGGNPPVVQPMVGVNKAPFNLRIYN